MKGHLTLAENPLLEMLKLNHPGIPIHTEMPVGNQSQSHSNSKMIQLNESVSLSSLPHQGTDKSSHLWAVQDSITFAVLKQKKKKKANTRKFLPSRSALLGHIYLTEPPPNNATLIQTVALSKTLSANKISNYLLIKHIKFIKC